MRRHKPSVIYIPNMDLWFRTISDAARETFITLIRGISPSDPILLLALVESPLAQTDPDLKVIFGYSLQNRVEVASATQESRYAYFKAALENLDKAPSDFPDATKKRKRVLEVLEKAPPPPPKVWTKAELQEQALKDKQTQNAVKLKLSCLMDLLKKRYQRFRKPIIVLPHSTALICKDDKDLALLARGEQEPEYLAQTKFRRNDDGTIRDVTSNKKFYNMDLDLVNDRLWNGYYLTPDQFILDIQGMVHDAKSWPDRDRTNRAEEMLVNTQSYISETFDETLIMECQRMAEREYERQKIIQAEKEAKAKKKAEREKEKERLRLAAAQQVQEAQSPTKMIETAPTNDVQMQDANGDDSRVVVNGNRERAEERESEGILFTLGGKQEAVAAQVYPPTSSTSPTPIQSYRPMPVDNGHQPSTSSHNSHHAAKPQASMYPLPYPFPSIQQIQPQPLTFSDPFNRPQGPVGTYPQPAYPNSSIALAATPYRPDLAHIPSPYPIPNHNTPPPSLTNQQSQQGSHVFHPPRTPGFSGAQASQNHSTAYTAPPPNHVSPTKSLPRPNVAPPAHPPLKRDPLRVEMLLLDLTRQTEGFTLEQLEQVYAACMDIIWRMRHEWDRTVAISETEKCVHRVLNEIDMMKKERLRDRLDT